MKTCRNRKCRAQNSDDASFCTTCGHAFPRPGRAARVWAWLFGMTALLSLTALGFEEYRLWQTRRQLADRGSTIETLSQRQSAERDSLVAKIDHLEQALIDSCHAFNDFRREVAHYYPLVIRSIEVGNVNRMREVIDNFGSQLRADRVEFLQPRIRYRGFAHGPVDLLVRWIRPDGTIRSMPDAPEGFSQVNQETFIYPEEKEVYLQGMGNDRPGNWPRGTYRLEIWHGDQMLGYRNVTLY